MTTQWTSCCSLHANIPDQWNTNDRVSSFSIGQRRRSASGDVCLSFAGGLPYLSQIGPFTWYLSPSLFNGYRGKVYIAVARIAHTSDILDSQRFIKHWMNKTSERFIMISNLNRFTADNTGLIAQDGTPLDFNLTTKWGGYTFTRNFSNGYLFKPVIRGCYFRTRDTWETSGMEVGENPLPRIHSFAGA